MGIIDMITGQNPNQGAINNAQNNATNATNAQNQLIQQGLLPIYNEMLSSWNNYYSPLQGGISNEMSALQGGNGLPGMSQLDMLTSIDPSLRDAFTGVPLSGMSNELMQYYMNPGGTLSGLNGVGGLALSGYLDPNTNLQSLTPGAISQLDPSQSVAGAVGGAAALPFFLNEAQHGFSPQTIGASLNPMDAQVQQQINSMRNSLGSGVPNIAGLTEDMNLQGLQSKAGLLSGIAGQNQQFQNQGMESALSAAFGLDQNTAARIAQQLQAGGNLDQQTYQRLAGGLQTAGGIDQQTQQMLNQAYNIANQQSGQGMNYLGSGLNTQQGLFGDILNYIGQGRNMLPGAASGIENLANLYGQSAGNAAGQATNLAQAGINQNQQTFSGLAGLFGNLAGAGAFGLPGFG